jgi:hypothetical protein
MWTLVNFCLIANKEYVICGKTAIKVLKYPPKQFGCTEKGPSEIPEIVQITIQYITLIKMNAGTWLWLLVPVLSSARRTFNHP